MSDRETENTNSEKALRDFMERKKNETEALKKLLSELEKESKPITVNRNKK